MYTAIELSSKSLKELKEIADRLDADPLGHAGRKASWVEGILQAQFLIPADIIGGFNCSVLPVQEISIEENPIRADQDDEVREEVSLGDPIGLMFPMDDLVTQKIFFDMPEEEPQAQLANPSMDGSSEPIDISKFLESINEKMTKALMSKIFSDSTFGEDIKDLQKWILDFVKEIPKPFPHFLLLGTDVLQLQKTILQAKAVGDIELHEALHNSLAKQADTIIMMIKYWLVDNDQRWDHPVLLRGKNDLCFFEKGGFILGEPAGDFGFSSKILCGYLEESSRQFQFMDSDEEFLDSFEEAEKNITEKLLSQGWLAMDKDICKVISSSS